MRTTHRRIDRSIDAVFVRTNHAAHNIYTRAKSLATIAMSDELAEPSAAATEPSEEALSPGVRLAPPRLGPPPGAGDDDDDDEAPPLEEGSSPRGAAQLEEAQEEAAPKRGEKAAIEPDSINPILDDSVEDTMALAREKMPAWSDGPSDEKVELVLHLRWAALSLGLPRSLPRSLALAISSSLSFPHPLLHHFLHPPCPRLRCEKILAARGSGTDAFVRVMLQEDGGGRARAKMCNR